MTDIKLTRTISSKDIARTGEIRTENLLDIPSYRKAMRNTSSSNNRENEKFNSLKLDMKGDERQPAHSAYLNEEIMDNGWERAKHERHISEKMVESMHRKDFFGGYKQSVKDLFQSSDLIKKEFFKELTSPNPNVEKIAQLLPSFHAYKNTLSQLKNSTNLKEIPAGSLVCLEESAVGAKSLFDVGIETDYCYGVGTNGKMDGHAFLQTKSGNIIECTSPGSSYRININGGRISKGEVALTYDPHTGARTSYGGGTTKAGSDISQVIKDAKANTDKAWEKLKAEAKEGIKKSDTVHPEFYLSALTTSLNGHDKDSALRKFAPIGAKNDGFLNAREIAAHLKSFDVKIGDSEKRDIKELMDGHGKIGIADLVDKVREEFKRMDTNKDGILSKAEKENANSDNIIVQQLFLRRPSASTQQGR